MPLLIYQAVVLSFVVSLLLILLVNMAVLPTLDKPTSSEEAPLVSILVPARNEEANIETCVRSLLAQSYPHFELLVLDDQSTDQTSAILAKLATDSRLHVLNGGSLLPGWLGKANACRQLAEAAKGKYLLFTDADTVHHRAALAAALAFMLQHSNGDATSVQSIFAPRVPWGLLSMFPRQITGTWSEWLVIPLMHFAVYALLPLPGAFRLRSAAFAAANGQFMLFSRAAYDAAGGHEGVRSQVLEDVALSRAVKGAGYAAVLVDGGDLVSTRMYRGLDELWAGFSKNLFAFFGNSLPFLIIGMAGYAVLYVLPIIWLLIGLWRLLFGPTLDTIALWAFVVLPLLQYAFAVLTRLILARRFGFSYGWSFLHPISIAFQIAIGFNSARLHRRGGAAWKGRRVA